MDSIGHIGSVGASVAGDNVPVTLPWRFSPLHGPRVHLDLLRPDDLDALSAIQADPGTVRYLLYDVRSRGEVAATLERDSGRTSLATAGDYVQPAIRDDAGRLVGTLYFTLTSVQDRTAEMGWVLSASERGKGYATEAARLALSLAFGELGLHRVYADIDPRNEASAAVCRRLGMRHEAHFRENMWLKGEWADTAIYAILEHEFRESSASS